MSGAEHLFLPFIRYTVLQPLLPFGGEYRIRTGDRPDIPSGRAGLTCHPGSNIQGNGDSSFFKPEFE